MEFFESGQLLGTGDQNLKGVCNLIVQSEMILFCFLCVVLLLIAFFFIPLKYRKIHQYY